MNRGVQKQFHSKKKKKKISPALFVKGEHWKKSKYQTIKDYLTRSWYSHTVKYYLIFKKCNKKFNDIETCEKEKEDWE